jgi:hypothetical protein
MFQFIKTAQMTNNFKLTEKSKVKIKIFPPLHNAPQILDVWRSGVIALEVLNLDTTGY